MVFIPFKIHGEWDIILIGKFGKRIVNVFHDEFVFTIVFCCGNHEINLGNFFFLRDEGIGFYHTTVVVDKGILHDRVKPPF